MVATQFSRAERRALRWMDRRGSGLQPSEEAFDLLVARVSARWWAGLPTFGPLLVFVFGWIRWSPIRQGMPAIETMLLSLVPVAAFGLAQWVFAALNRRSDQRIVAVLPHRVSRSRAVPVWTVLGSFASVVVGLAVVGHAVIAVLLLRWVDASDAVAYVVGVGVVGVIVVLALRQVLRRPTVAVDPSALAVDERLRATDALIALSPVYWAAFGLVTALDLRGARGSEIIVLLGGVLSIASSLMWFSHPNERAKYGRGGIYGPA